MATYAKHLDRYKQIRSSSQKITKPSSFRNTSMIDRDEYIKYMEQELEKVGATFLKIKNLPERVEQLQSQIILNQEKTNNLSKIVNLVQETENSQENDLRDIKAALKEIDGNPALSDKKQFRKPQTNFSHDLETSDLLQRIRKLEERISMPLDINSLKQSSEKSFAIRMNKSLEELEQRLTQMISNHFTSKRPPKKPASK